MPPEPGRVVDRRQADDNHEVITREGGGEAMPSPCPTCPWVQDNVGEFPAEAFVLSAPTSYDQARRVFGCHATARAPVSRICAGAVHGTGHSLRLRFLGMTGALDHVGTGDRPLWGTYREMAEANGVPPDHPALEQCR